MGSRACRPRQHPAQRVDGVVADPGSIERGVGMPGQEPPTRLRRVPGRQSILIDLILTRLDVDDDLLPNVLFRLNLRPDRLFVKLLPPPADLFQAESGVSYHRVLIAHGHSSTWDCNIISCCHLLMLALWFPFPFEGGLSADGLVEGRHRTEFNESSSRYLAANEDAAGFRSLLQR